MELTNESVLSAEIESALFFMNLTNEERQIVMCQLQKYTHTQAILNAAVGIFNPLIDNTDKDGEYRNTYYKCREELSALNQIAA